MEVSGYPEEETQRLSVLGQRLPFQVMFEQSIDAALLLRGDAIVDCNQAAVAQFACRDKSELLGLTVHQLSSPPQVGEYCSCDDLNGKFLLALQDGQNRCVWRSSKRDGTGFDAEVALTATAVGAESLLFMALRDISETRRFKERFEAVYANSRDGIALLDLESRFIAANPAYLNMTGLLLDELLCASFISLSAPEDVLRSKAVLEEVLTTGFVGSYEKTCLLENGRRVVVDMALTLMPNRQCILANVRDITLKRSLEQALYLAKERAEITLAAIGDAVITTDESGLVTFMNSAAAALTGWTGEEALGKKLSGLFHILDEATRQRVDDPVEQALRDGKTVKSTHRTVLISRHGLEYNIEDSAAPIYLADGRLAGSVLVLQDVTEKYNLLNAANWQFSHDVLTGLPNRVLLGDRFKRAIARAQRNQCLLGVCMLELDGFKPINEQYGHHVGDAILAEIANRLNAVVRGDDTVARLGGDEFVVLLGEIHHLEEFEVVMKRLMGELSRPFGVEGQWIHLSASIGSAFYPRDNLDEDILLRYANQAMYQAKQHGRNQHQLFDASTDASIRQTHQIAKRVKHALEAGELILHYQPKLDMRSGRVYGMEALLRWAHPVDGMIPPLDFLPQVEQTDVIIDIGEWVIEQALQQMSGWRAAGEDWSVSVNIAARHFQHREFLPRLKAALARFPMVSPRLLEIELLESVAFGDIHYIHQLVLDCQALGITFAIDDFGMGYSSLSYLKQLPAETIKIDRSFVRTRHPG